MSQQRDYQILETTELSDLKWTKGGKFKKQIKFNYASIYQLKDKRFILIPSKGSPGILFETREALERMIKEEYFPVPEDTTNPLIKNRDKILNLEANILYFVKELEQEMSVKLTGENDSLLFQDSILEILSDNISKTLVSYDDKDELIFKIIVPLTVFIGEFIKNKVDVHWELRKSYTLNPFWSFDLYDNRKRPRNLAIMTVLDHLILDGEKIDLKKVVNEKIEFVIK